MGAPYYTHTYPRQLSRLLPDLIRGRRLLWDLVWKDVKVRYRYAALGFLWAVLEPLLMMLVLTFVFSIVFKMLVPELGVDSGREYAVFVLSGLIFWQFFSNALSTASKSLVDNRDLIKKVYFPREVVPLASIGVAFVNFIIGFVLLLVVFTLLMQRVPFGLPWILIPLAIQCALIVGLALIFAAGHANFRDVGYMVDAALLFLFYASPVFYWPSLVAERLSGFWYTLYSVNPMVGLLTAYRHALFLDELPQPGVLIWPAIFAVVALVTGVVVFRRSAPTLADHL